MLNPSILLDNRAKLESLVAITYPIAYKKVIADDYPRNKWAKQLAVEAVALAKALAIELAVQTEYTSVPAKLPPIPE